MERDEARSLVRDLGGLFREVAARFGRVAVLKGFITPEQLQEALQEQKAAPPGEPPPLLGQILLRRRWITTPQLVEVLHTLRQEGEAGEDGGVPFGRYRIVSEIGRGGMGVIFRAFDPDLKRIVALKILKEELPSGVRRLRREAVTAGHLHHPGIVSIHEIGEVDGTHFIAMDFVEGETLDRTWKGMEIRKRVEILRKVAEAVGHAHDNGVVHRDLKPENVIVKPNGDPVVTDFGLAKMQDASVQLTASGDRMGTPAYMAPEQIEGNQKQIGPWTDVYQLGTILYEMLTGVRPFHGLNVTELYGRILRGNAPRPSKVNPKIPRDLDTVCTTAMDPDRRRRYPDATALGKDLARWLRGEAIRTNTAGSLTLAWRRIRRHALGIAGAGAALLLVACVVWLATTLRRKAIREESGRLLAEADRTLQKWWDERYKPSHDLRPARAELELVVEKLRKRLRIAPAEPSVCARLGFVLIELGRFDEAERELAEAIRQSPNEGYYPYLIGRAHLNATLRKRVSLAGEEDPGEVDRVLERRRTSALTHLRRSLELPWSEGPEWQRAHARAYVLHAEGKWAETEAACAEMAETFKAEGGEEGLLLLGASYENRHEHGKASEAFGQAAQRAQSLVEAHLRAANSLMTSRCGFGGGGKTAYTEALKYAARAVEIMPDLPEAWVTQAGVRVEWGSVLAERGEDSAATIRAVVEEDVPKALALDPECPEAWYLLGLAVSQQAMRSKEQLWPKAVEALTRALDFAPLLDRARFWRGVVLRTWAASVNGRGEDPTQLGERSLADLREVERALPQWAQPWLEEAKTLGVLALYEKAVNVDDLLSKSALSCSEAIRRSPKSDQAWAFRAQTRANLAYATVKRKEDPTCFFEGSVEDWSRALSLVPPSAERLFNRGVVHLGWGTYLGTARKFDPGRIERAIEDFVGAVGLDPGFSKGWAFLAKSRVVSADFLALRKRDSEASIRYGEAAEAFTRSLQSKEPGPESLWERGYCRMKLGEVRAALADLEMAVAHDASLEPKLRPWIELCRKRE